MIARCRQVYFLDECGVDHRLYNPYARAMRGEAVFARVSGAQRGRTSVISACAHGRLVSPMVFQGNCTGEVVEAYLKKMLLPSIPVGSVIVLDNAAFHRRPSTIKLVESAKCSLLFLPSYSPDLNPIENIWAVMKAKIRPGLQMAKNKIKHIVKTCLCCC